MRFSPYTAMLKCCILPQELFKNQNGNWQPSTGSRSINKCIESMLNENELYGVKETLDTSDWHLPASLNKLVMKTDEEEGTHDKVVIRLWGNEQRCLA